MPKRIAEPVMLGQAPAAVCGNMELLSTPFEDLCESPGVSLACSN